MTEEQIDKMICTWSLETGTAMTSHALEDLVTVLAEAFEHYEKESFDEGRKAGMEEAAKIAHKTVEPDVGRVVTGIPFRVDRLKCLGNSIVPQIAEWIAERIKQVENEKGQKGIASDPAPFGGSQHGNCE